MARWADLEAEAGDLASSARQLLEQFGFVLAGTIRRDGTPRISPVEGHIVEGRLMLVMQEGTLKARDVLRDPRIVLNTPVTDRIDPGAELKLRGHLVSVDDPELRAATSDAIHSASGWRPPKTWHFFSVELEDVAHIAWVGGAMRMSRWRPGRPVELQTRPPPETA